MKATELADELIKWRRTQAKRGPAAWLSARIRDVEAEIDAREEPAPPSRVARGIDQVQSPIDEAAITLPAPPPVPDDDGALDTPPESAPVALSGTASGGAPARWAGLHALLRDDTDPWVRLQQSLLAQAERNGDSARAAFYRAVLAGDPLPGVLHRRLRAR